jgi:hypothetical protein
MVTPPTSCAAKPTVTVGRPAGRGGCCELQRSSRGALNAQCYAPGGRRPACTTADVMISEVNGQAAGAGPDWLELKHVGGADAPTCYLRGCQIITSECASDGGGECTDIVPYTPMRFDLNLGRGERALVYENAEFAAAAAGVDMIPAAPVRPLTAVMCCASGFSAPWAGVPSA